MIAGKLDQQLPFVIFRMFDDVIQQKLQHLTQDRSGITALHEILAVNGKELQGKAFSGAQNGRHFFLILSSLEPVCDHGSAFYGICAVFAQGFFPADSSIRRICIQQKRTGAADLDGAVVHAKSMEKLGSGLDPSGMLQQMAEACPADVGMLLQF